MKGIAANFSVYNLVTVVQYFQALDGANGKVKEGKKRHAAFGHEGFQSPVGSIAVEFVPVGAKGGKILKIVGARGFEYASDERLLSRLEVQPDKLYRPDKVLAFWIRLFDNDLGKLKLAFQSQRLLRYPAHNRAAFPEAAHDCACGICVMCVYRGSTRV